MTESTVQTKVEVDGVHIFPFTCNFEGSIDNTQYLTNEPEMLVYGRRVTASVYTLDNLNITEWSTKTSKDIMPHIMALKNACEQLNNVISK